MDLTDVAQAVEAYKTNQGDYPPDYSDPALVKRHILKVWPNIDNTELAGVLNRVHHIRGRSGRGPGILAGWLQFRSQVTRSPGPGGPFIVYPTSDGPGLRQPGTATWAGGNRQGPADLASLPWSSSAGPPQIVGQLSSDGDNDPFPVFLPPERKEPYVYFDSRTYGGLTKPPSHPDQRLTIRWHRQPGVAKPYLPRPPRPRTLAVRFRVGQPRHVPDHQRRAGRPLRVRSVPGRTRRLYPRFPDGDELLSRRANSGGDDDNITNFSEGSTLEDKKP